MLPDMNCPICSKPARYGGLGLRGGVGAYWTDHVWYCADDYICDYSGVPIFADDTPADVQQAVAFNRSNFVRYRWLREARQRAIGGRV